MRTLLWINACVRGRHSRTLELTKVYLNQRKEREQVTIIERNLSEEPLECMTATSFDKETGEQKSASTKWAEEFASADEIILSAPYWEFLFPAVVNCYFERVSMVGQTFCYTDTGSVGLCKASHFHYIYTAGDHLQEEDKLNERYLEKLTKLYGIKNFSVIMADGLDIQGNHGEQIVADLCATIKENEIER